jgi:hypothetical protein
LIRRTGNPQSRRRDHPDAAGREALHDRGIVQANSPPSSAVRSEAVYGAPATASTTLVRFAGGPWDGRRARYVHVVELTPMPCPGGRYVFREFEADGTAVYSFTVA